MRYKNKILLGLFIIKHKNLELIFVKFFFFFCSLLVYINNIMLVQRPLPSMFKYELGFCQSIIRQSTLLPCVPLLSLIGCKNFEIFLQRITGDNVLKNPERGELCYRLSWSGAVRKWNLARGNSDTSCFVFSSKDTVVPFSTVPCMWWFWITSRSRHLSVRKPCWFICLIMADTGEGDSEYRIKEGDNVVLKRGDIFKAVQIQLKK